MTDRDIRYACQIELLLAITAKRPHSLIRFPSFMPA